MRKRRVLYGAFSGVLIIAFSALLLYLLWGWDKEPQADYSWLVSKVASNTESVESFAIVEPNGVYHIGDPITVRFGVAYDPRVWEVPDEVFYSAFPFPDGFELRERSVRTTKFGSFSVIEIKLKVQCLECRDKTYYMDFGPMTSPRARNKDTGEVTSVRFDPAPKLRFAPLTNEDYRIDEKDLVTFAIKEQRSWRVVFFGIAGVAFAVAIFLALRSLSFSSRTVETEEYAGGNSRYLSRVRELEKQLLSRDARFVAHSLYALILVFRDDYADASGTLEAILTELADVYSKEGIEKELLIQMLGKVEVFLTEQGEA